MQISWQAQRFVKLEVQILCGNLGRDSKPQHLLNSYQKLKNPPDQRVLPFPFTKTFLHRDSSLG